jgi:hypothetical protein
MAPSNPSIHGLTKLLLYNMSESFHVNFNFSGKVVRSSSEDFTNFFLYTVNRFNSTVLKFHDFSKSTYRVGFNFTLQENQIKFRALGLLSDVSRCRA